MFGGGRSKSSSMLLSLIREGREDKFLASLARPCFLLSRLLVLLPNSKRVDLLNGAKALAARGDDHGETPRVIKAVHVRGKRFDRGERT